MNGEKKLRLTPDAALVRIKSYCAYQERSHHEVEQQLYSWGILPDEAAEIISTLIEENYLNEERFALAYAGGKFRTLQWGRNKIKYQLKLKRVSEYCINKALQHIPEEDYSQCFKKLAQAKYATLRDKNKAQKHAKLKAYMHQKGYEFEYINAFLKTT